MVFVTYILLKVS